MSTIQQVIRAAVCSWCVVQRIGIDHESCDPERITPKEIEELVQQIEEALRKHVYRGYL